MSNAKRVTSNKPYSLHLRLGDDLMQHIRDAAACYGVTPVQYIRIILQADMVKWRAQL